MRGRSVLSRVRTRALPLIVVIISSLVVAVLSSEIISPYVMSRLSLRSAIVDEESVDYPNPTLISSLARIMESAGYSVDVYGGPDVTVDLYRVLPTKGYRFVLFRVHAAFDKGEAWLFTSEPYSLVLRNKYAFELVSNQIARARRFIGEDIVLAVGPEFVRAGSRGNYAGAIILVAGCYGTAGESLPRAFVERGASVVVGWNGLVSAEHADSASLMFVQLLFEEKLEVPAVVEEVTLHIGGDPNFHSSLTYYSTKHPPRIAHSTYTPVDISYSAEMDVFVTSPNRDVQVPALVAASSSVRGSRGASVAI